MALPAHAERVIREVIQRLAASRRTFRSHQIERARAEGAKKDAPSVGLARALDQARSILAAALQAAAPKKETSDGEEKK